MHTVTMTTKLEDCLDCPFCQEKSCASNVYKYLCGHPRGMKDEEGGTVLTSVDGGRPGEIGSIPIPERCPLAS